MKVALAVLLFGLVAVSAENWAVIVAGSNTYSNYRHQADACHAFHIMKRNGIPESNIITMIYDDIADNSRNPFPGKVFNKPTEAGTPGVDVYEGCGLDYTGTTVTAKNFLKIITGDESAGGKVLKSTSEDRVFLNFADHGGVGLIAFPSGGYLYSKDLNEALQTMADKKMYKELVFYLEACESGSMFENLLPTDINIYATSAANAHESSWGTYCYPEDKIDGKSIGSCLGDLYSVNWMEDSDNADMQTESLEEQFEIVKNETTKSHVMEFGTMTFNAEPIGDFQGEASALKRRARMSASSKSLKEKSAVDSRDITLHQLYGQYMTASDDMRSEIAAELIAEIQSREKADKLFKTLAATAFGAEKYGAYMDHVHMPKNWACYEEVNNAINQYCGGYTDYSLKYTKVVVNICEAAPLANGARTVVSAVRDFC